MADNKLVYSTDQGRICFLCQQPVANCKCKKTQEQQIIGSGAVRVAYSTKGRKGKGVTIISELPLNPVELAKTAKKLKSYCATGGTVKDGNVEIQGEHEQKILDYLKGEGYQVKISGG